LFTSNSAVFDGGAAKMFFISRHRVPQLRHRIISCICLIRKEQD